MHRFDGDTDEEAKLWHSYMRIARDHIVESGAIPTTEIRPVIDDDSNVWSETAREAIQTILFSSFILEARLKRVLTEMGRPPRKFDGLNNILSNFWPALSQVKRINADGFCSPPAEWAQVEGKLNELRRLRNLMAHGNLAGVLLHLRSESAHVLARDLYNGVMSAIVLVNLGTGYETRSPEEAWKGFAPLLMRSGDAAA